MTNFGWSLPPGVTDSMCEPDDPRCANCGCLWSAHYEHRDDEVIPHPLRRDPEHYWFAAEYNNKGEIVHGCDSLINDKQCDCLEFVEGEYEPECYDDE